MNPSSLGCPAALSTVAQHRSLESLQDGLLVASQCTDQGGWLTQHPDIQVQELVGFQKAMKGEHVHKAHQRSTMIGQVQEQHRLKWPCECIGEPESEYSERTSKVFPSVSWVGSSFTSNSPARAARQYRPGSFCESRAGWMACRCFRNTQNG